MSVSNGPVSRGSLRVYLGAAPGVGKTFAMLEEAARRRERGADVVVGYVETHDRPPTNARRRDLEVVARRTLLYRGARLEEMDVDAVEARRPAVALVDELAHTNVTGSRHPKRWQDVEQLVASGIDVITTVNIQHLESLNDVVAAITGVRQAETVPDEVVRRADQVELVDMSPEALRRRLAHGHIFPPDEVDAALANAFRLGNLTALRELTLRWMADRVGEDLQDYMRAQGITEPWETRERMVVAIDGSPGGEVLVRRARRMATRAHSELIGLHVEVGDGLEPRVGQSLARQRSLLIELGGTYREVVGADVARAIVAFADAERVTQVVLGGCRRSRWPWHRSLADRLASASAGLDVHIVATGAGAGDGPGAGEHDPGHPLPHVADRHGATPGPFTRRVAAVLLAVAGLPLLTTVLAASRDHVGLPSALLFFLVMTIVVAALGGLVVGVVTAIAAAVLVNWFFVPPLHELRISDAENIVALVVFVAVAAVVSILVDRAATRSREALRARAEAEVLARATATLVGEHDPLPDLLDQLRTTFALDSVSVLSAGDGGWIVEASAGPDAPVDPAGGERWDLDEAATTVLVVRGAGRSDAGQRVLRSFLSQLAVALQRRVLQARAADAARLAATDVLRTALLQAVSHDLRTPLATIKASATSLLQADVRWSLEERHAFARSIDEETDRLDRVVANLLDLSRLRAGAVAVVVEPVYLDDVVAQALATIGQPKEVVVVVAETVPPVEADPTLLERAVANVVANAVAWAPPAEPVRVEAAVVGDRVHLRVVDRGPGIAPQDRAAVFEPFQRRGDRSSQAGAGLGLAVARGFVEAQGGELLLEDTPGGGLTVVFELALAR